MTSETKKINLRGEESLKQQLRLQSRDPYSALCSHLPPFFSTSKANCFRRKLSSCSIRTTRTKIHQETPRLSTGQCKLSAFPICCSASSLQLLKKSCTFRLFSLTQVRSVPQAADQRHGEEDFLRSGENQRGRSRTDRLYAHKVPQQFDEHSCRCRLALT